MTSKDKFSNKIRPSRPLKLTPKAERHLLRAAANNICANLACLGTPSKSGKILSHTTIRKILNKYGKACCHARKKPYLSAKHKRCHMRFGRDNRGQNWWLICWSDKSIFEISYDGQN